MRCFNQSRYAATDQYPKCLCRHGVWWVGGFQGDAHNKHPRHTVSPSVHYRYVSFMSYLRDLEEWCFRWRIDPLHLQRMSEWSPLLPIFHSLNDLQPIFHSLNDLQNPYLIPFQTILLCMIDPLGPEIQGFKGRPPPPFFEWSPAYLPFFDLVLWDHTQQYTKFHQNQKWSGSFSDFLDDLTWNDPIFTSHEIQNVLKKVW